MSGPKTSGAVGNVSPVRLAGASAFDLPLSRETLEQALGLADSVQLEVVEQTGSTNDDLLDRARVAAADRPAVRAALHQVAGRGRHGRRWHDARGRALLFSVMTRWFRDPAAAALRGLGIEARLKWPNDILLAGRKRGGILTELALDPRPGASLVVGVGVNLCLDPEQRVAIDQPAAALDERIEESRLASERERWIATLARAVLDAVEQFEQQGFAPFRARFDALFAYAGRSVVLVNGYRNPAQLGADRWHAMNAARQSFPGHALVVVCAGTATTVDSIEATGRFLGGAIAPGTSLMADSLARGTACLPRSTGQAVAMPDNTDDAIATGVAEALAGLVERRVRALARLDRPPQLILAGGRVRELASRLSLGDQIAGMTIEEQLVLRGLWFRASAIADGPEGIDLRDPT